MRLPAPHDGTPMFGPSFSTLSEQGRGAARHLDFGRGRNRSGSSRTCSSCRPEHMSCSHHVQGPAVPLERPETPFYVRSRRRGNADWTSRGTAIAKGCMSEHDCLRPKGRKGCKGRGRKSPSQSVSQRSLLSLLAFTVWAVRSNPHCSRSPRVAVRYVQQPPARVPPPRLRPALRARPPRPGASLAVAAVFTVSRGAGQLM